MTLPAPCGPISAAVIAALALDDVERLPDPARLPDVSDPVTDDDLQLSLWVCYELHYRGFGSVSDRWEWQPDLLRVRWELEERLLTALRRQVMVATDAAPIDVVSADTVPTDATPIAERLSELVDRDDGPQLSRYLQQQGQLAQYREFAIHRSIYQLKESDPHSWAIPRLAGRAKVALVEIQVDEYGDGRPDRMHSELYRGLLRCLRLDDRYGAYVDVAPGITLAISNVMSLFGLRRELRGALAGHLAAYEMTSSAPCRRYARGLRRLGFGDDACAFHDAHVTADALHEQLAAHDLCGALAEDEPELADQILFGAATSLYVDNRFAEYVLGRWAENRSSLREGPREARSGSQTALCVTAADSLAASS